MTLDQHEKAKILRERIQRLENLVIKFKRDSNKGDESEFNATMFTIVGAMGGHVHTVNYAELAFLIEAIESEIHRLEFEFERL